MSSRFDSLMIFIAVFGRLDRVDRDAKSKREGLNDCLGRIGHAHSKGELAQLIKENCGDSGGYRKSPPAQQGRAAQHHHRD